ncbi:MAG: hypothetical protein M0017_06425 [Desulfobacteraceae bacterium]|nr:hypothetical protein [Desulfobacteraceae bacterium]
MQQKVRDQAGYNPVLSHVRTHATQAYAGPNLSESIGLAKSRSAAVPRCAAFCFPVPARFVLEFFYEIIKIRTGCAEFATICSEASNGGVENGPVKSGKGG